jgi:universal stress protein A
MKALAKHYRQLLAAVDLGEMTAPVVARAGELGRRMEAALDLVNIQEGVPVFLYHAVSTDELNAILDKSARWSRERLSQIKTREPWVRDVHTADGVLAEEARAVAKRIGSDLILIGAHERRGVAVLMRDRSDEILHKAPCDVLVVKRRDGLAAEPPKPYQRILAAVDLADDGEQVAARAAHLASLYGAELHLLNVIDHFPVDRSNTVIPPEDEDPLSFQRREAIGRLCVLAREAGLSQCRHEVVSTTETASREVPAYAGRLEADLIVAGSHGRHGLGRLLGSTVDGIVHRAPCDVLVVRTRPKA